MLFRGVSLRAVRWRRRVGWALRRPSRSAWWNRLPCKPCVARQRGASVRGHDMAWAAWRQRGQSPARLDDEFYARYYSVRPSVIICTRARTHARAHTCTHTRTHALAHPDAHPDAHTRARALAHHAGQRSGSCCQRGRLTSPDLVPGGRRGCAAPPAASTVGGVEWYIASPPESVVALLGLAGYRTDPPPLPTGREGSQAQVSGDQALPPPPRSRRHTYAAQQAGRAHPATSLAAPHVRRAPGGPGPPRHLARVAARTPRTKRARSTCTAADETKKPYRTTRPANQSSALLSS